jgi:hypothetical protein
VEYFLSAASHATQLPMVERMPVSKPTAPALDEEEADGQAVQLGIPGP